MKNPEQENLKIRLDDLEEQLNDFDENELSDIISELEEKINTQKEFESNEGRFNSCDKLLNRIWKIKRDFNFFDKETELDNMYPDRHDSDFDEDSM
jgi:hypothetical protein